MSSATNWKPFCDAFNNAQNDCFYNFYEFHKEHIDEIIKELKLLFPDSEIYYGHKVQDIDHRVYEVLVKVPNIGYLSELSFIRINWT